MLYKKHWLLPLLLLVTACGTATVKPQTHPVNPQPFAAWLSDFETEARAQGISQNVLDDAFANIDAPSLDILDHDHTQPEKTKSFPEYRKAVVSNTKVANAKAAWESHQATLKRIEDTYNVPAPILLSLWGIESNFGARQGSYSIIESLTTLAYDGRRSQFFRTQLIDALKIIQDQHMAAKDLIGSWAGAMGQTQFMPSSYLSFAVDFDGDGKKDIWANDADALASIANYLHQRGWDGSIGWGIEVKLPYSFNRDWNKINDAKSLSEWQALGVKQVNGDALPENLPTARLILPDNDPSSAFLVFSNYSVIMDWNHSTYFATSVGLLADAIQNQ